MRPNRVKELWRTGKPVSTGWCSTVDPYATEAMARAGFDALILDMQHGMAIGPERAATWLQIVAQTETTPIVRIPWNEPSFAQWVLDAGAMGIIIPMVNNVADAKRAIGACRYPPVGYRSYAPNRAAFYGPDYFAKANEEIICLVMLETLEAIANAEAIADLPGFDGFFVGPIDLGVSMGIAPFSEHKDSRHPDALRRVVEVAKAHGQVAGVFATSPAEAVQRFREGFNLNPSFLDMWSLAAASSRAVSEFRDLSAG